MQQKWDWNFDLLCAYFLISIFWTLFSKNYTKFPSKCHITHFLYYLYNLNYDNTRDAIPRGFKKSPTPGAPGYSEF